MAVKGQRLAEAAAWLRRQDGRWMTLPEITAGSGVPGSTVRRALITLEAAGQLETSATWPVRYRVAAEADDLPAAEVDGLLNRMLARAQLTPAAPASRDLLRLDGLLRGLHPWPTRWAERHANDVPLPGDALPSEEDQ